jgi:serine/threonine-protein kinase
VSREALWDRWEEIDELLERALDLPIEEQDAFLATQCGEDPELLRTVLELARLSREPEKERMGPGEGILRAVFLGLPAVEPDSPDALLGVRVGPYRLTRVLGVGGMGAVYLGERDDGSFERRVAVKVLRRELHSRGVLEKFKLERQILASLSHGAIAQMIDGGVTDDGHPALILEYVEGVPIDQYADEARLGLEERVRLILRVAEAVEYAHRHMVVHRDLKPSNILVTRDGAVKLLDFGIAKVLEESGGEEAGAVTRPEARFVTPEYAAPEQLLGERVSTQTDVYALGGLLYELLTGIRPYSRRGSESVLERMIRNAEPTAPSAAVFPTGSEDGVGEAEGISRLGGLPGVPGTNPDALRRRLSGDLDAILLRALQTRPEARYESVAAMRDDLRRHLSGHPVSARGDAALYRARRFVRRHRAPVATAAGAFLIAVGSAVGLAVQRGAVLEEQRRAEVAAETASREAETARQVTAFLVGLFEGNDPYDPAGDTLTVRSLLERGTDRIDRELADQPAIRAELLEVLGQVYANLGDFEEGIPLIQRGVALRGDSIQGHPDLAGSLLRLAEAMRSGREFQSSVKVYREAIAEASERGDRRAVAEARIGLGNAYMMLERLDSAEVQLRSGIAALGELRATGDLGYLNALVSLAGLVRRRGDLATSEGLYRQVIEVQRQRPLMDASGFATTLNNLAVLRRMQGDLGESRELYREAYDSLVHVLGPGHPSLLMISGNMAALSDQLGEVEESLKLYRERVQAARQRWPEGHWRTAEALMNLGAQLVKLHRADEAVEPLVEALDLAMVQIGPRHSWTNVYRGWLGAAAALTGRTTQADQLFSWSLEGLSQYEELSGDLQVKSMLRSLIEVMEESGLGEEASRYRALGDLSEAPGG